MTTGRINQVSTVRSALFSKKKEKRTLPPFPKSNNSQRLLLAKGNHGMIFEVNFAITTKAYLPSNC